MLHVTTTTSWERRKFHIIFRMGMIQLPCVIGSSVRCIFLLKGEGEGGRREGEVSTISSQLALTQMDGNILLIITEKGEKIATSPRSL